MKTPLLLTAVAGLLLTSPLALPASAQQGPGSNHPPPGDHERPGPQQDRDHKPGPPAPPPQHDSRTRWRDTRPDARWDESRHNGYYVGKTWHVGPPPEDAYRRRGFTLAYKPWAKGDRLGYYSKRYVEVDYRSHHLKKPPRGYHWVQDDRGDYILAAIATGLIASVIYEALHGH